MLVSDAGDRCCHQNSQGQTWQSKENAHGDAAALGIHHDVCGDPDHVLECVLGVLGVVLARWHLQVDKALAIGIRVELGILHVEGDVLALPRRHSGHYFVPARDAAVGVTTYVVIRMMCDVDVALPFHRAVQMVVTVDTLAVMQKLSKFGLLLSESVVKVTLLPANRLPAMSEIASLGMFMV